MPFVRAFLRRLKRRSIAPGSEQETEPKSIRQRMPEHEQKRQKLKSIKRELRQKRRERSQLGGELRVAKRVANRRERAERERRMKSKKLEIFRLENELQAAKARTEGAPETGALPDFVIIGAPKCGTTFLYNLLTKHPHVQSAAFKEVHYFDSLFEKGIEWYRGCFLPPRWKDGRMTIIGEATPGYLVHPHAAERMADVIPEARLIAMLRNPVDRTYSDYQFFEVRHGQEKGTFEETIAAYLDRPHGYNPLHKSIYVDHLLRWSSYFSDEQMLVLKSEDVFECPQEMLKRVLDFLDLPVWTPTDSDLQDRRNKGSYEQPMNPITRRQLEEYFKPHNQRLYEHLGEDFGW
jgi:Sulfotransferase domain